MEKANFGQIVSFLFGIANDCLEITPCGKFRATKFNMQMYSSGRKREHS